MTRDEIETMLPDQLTALLAEKVMGWTLKTTNGVPGWPRNLLYWDKPHRLQSSWKPTTDRNDLRELLLAVPDDSWQGVVGQLNASYSVVDGPDVGWSRFLLTCDPCIICEAVAVACCGGDA
jgi:hypothetical protein